LDVERVSITIDSDLLERLETYMAKRGYASRSEALRDMVRGSLMAEEAPAEGACLAALTYVYDHHKRQLSNRLTEAHHDHHGLSIATMHVHLDHDSCLEVSILRGAVAEVKQLADKVVTQSGVRHGHVHIVPAEISLEAHSHSHGTGHSHSHGESRTHSHPDFHLHEHIKAR
jgi:CopG family nickel-responsive transcriptional regulator